MQGDEIDSYQTCQCPSHQQVYRESIVASSANHLFRVS
jgi:hypothetical protein